MLYLLTTLFPKELKIQFFYRIFIKNFQNIHKNFQTIFFTQRREKLTQGFYNFLKKAKIVYFCNFFNKLFANFRKFSCVRGLRPSDPLKCPPSNRNPGGAAANEKSQDEMKLL